MLKYFDRWGLWSDPETLMLDIGGTWRARLFSRVALLTALIHLTIPPLYRLLSGAWLASSGLLIGIGFFTLAVRLTPGLAMTTRAALLFLGYSVTLAAVALTVGFVPGFIAAFHFYLVMTGLLLGRWGMCTLLVGLALGFWGIAVGLEHGVIGFPPDPQALDDHAAWTRVAVVYGLIMWALIGALRSTARILRRAHAQLLARRVEVAMARSASQAAQDERLAAERRLRAAQKIQILSQLSGGLAHHFNNALTVARGELEALRGAPTLEARVASIQAIKAAFDGPQRTTHQLLRLSRGVTQATPAPAPLGALIEGLIADLRGLIPADVTLTARAEVEAEVRLTLDPLKLAVTHLLMNAVEACDQRGRVHVSIVYAAPEADLITHALITIEDSGRGIHPEALKGLLNPAFGGARGRVGVGLSLAHTVIEGLGGALSIESEVDVGTRARFTLPLATPLASADVPSSACRPMSTPSPPLDARPSRVEISAAPLTPQPTPSIDEPPLRRLARVTAAALVGIIALHWTTTPSFTWWIYTLIAVGGASIALVGWARWLPTYAHLYLLTGGLIIASLAVLIPFSYTNAVGLSGAALAIAWGASFGARREGDWLLVGVTLALIGGGIAHEAGLFSGLSRHFDINDPVTWTRFGFQIALLGGAWVTTIIAPLERARRGAVEEAQACAELEALRQREAREGARRLSLEAQQTRLERAAVLGRMAGALAHDLRNAIQAIHLVELLDAPEMTPAEITADLDALEAAIEHAEALTSQFDVDSAVEGPAAPCDLSVVTRGACHALSHLLPDAITLKPEIEPGVGARVSPSGLKRILFNLIINARDAMPSGGRVDLSLKGRDARVVLIVEDTGEGIEAAQHARVFEAFFSTKPEGVGAGLGLHIVAEEVRRSGGEIHLESSPAQGARFTISWPRSTPAPRSDAATPQPRRHAQGGVVLLAEDEPGVQRVMQRTLREGGYDVRLAADGDAALAQIEEIEVLTAACVDGVMPGAPTSEVIARLRARHPHAPILLCSGHLPRDLTARGLDLACVHWLPKPFSPARLLATLSSALGDAPEGG